jgi:hypothetical protein
VVDIALTPLEFELEPKCPGEIACDMSGIQPEAGKAVKTILPNGRGGRDAFAEGRWKEP